MATYTRYDKKVLSDDLLIKKLKIAAKKYQQYVNKDILIVYARSKKGPFFAYEFHAGEENFQHLVGVKSPNGAVWFFNKCLDQKNPIERKDIVPKKDIKTTSSKINILPEAVDLTKAKAYKIGEKDLITLNCEFDIAIGNVNHILGLGKRNHLLPIPITVMDKSIYEFASSCLTIFLIMIKDEKCEKYNDIYYEITPNIIEKANFNDEILKHISTNKTVDGVQHNSTPCIDTSDTINIKNVFSEVAISIEKVE